MSTEIITQGNDFLIIKDDRAFGGSRTQAFKVDGATGAVTLPSRTVTAAQLAAAAAAKLPGTPTLTVGALISDARIVTIQLKDIAGVNMSGVQRAQVWVSGTAKGSPIGTSTTGLTTAVTTGTLALTKLANLDFDILSDTSGVIGVSLTDAAGTETRFVNVAVNGIVTASAAVVTT